MLTPGNAGLTEQVAHNGLLRAVKNAQNVLAGEPTDAVVAPVK